MFMGLYAPGRIRTCEGTKPMVLETITFDRFATGAHMVRVVGVL
tara:strand:+ start:654 stop:785 length:132 start_codon:yes stop_codon:yes gene_type:complete